MKLEIATSDLDIMCQIKRSIHKGYQVMVEMLKSKLLQDDITNAISYYCEIVNRDNAVRAEMIEFQVDDLARSREELAFKNSQYHDLSSVSVKQLLTLCELLMAKRSLKPKLSSARRNARTNSNSTSGSLSKRTPRMRPFGDKIHTIIRLGASGRTKSELDQTDGDIERLDEQLWAAEQRTEELLERSRVYEEARVSDRTFAAVQDKDIKSVSCR